jgi:VWFA-related protein
MRKKTLNCGALLLLAAISLTAAELPDSPGLTVLAVSSPTAVAGVTSSTVAASIFAGYTIQRTVPEVRFQFTVADERGRLVNGLSLSDFRIFDNQSPVHAIREFSRSDGLPLQLGILLDVSDSVGKAVAREKVAAESFIQQVIRPETDRSSVMSFAGDVKLLQAATGDTTALRRALLQVQQPGHTTNLYDGLFFACFSPFPQFGEHDPAQRIIVLFSDGEDTGSLHGIRDVIALAQRKEIQIYALSVHDKRRSAPGDETLRRLTDETGGRLYVASSDRELAAIFADMD